MSVSSTPRHVHLDAQTLQRENRERPWGPGSVYYRTPRSYRSTHSGIQSSQARTPMDPHSPRASVSTLQLQHLLEKLEMDQYNTYGVEELRDGFFDASFYRPIKQDTRLRGESKPLLPPEESTFKRPSPLSPREFWRSQVSDTRDSFRIVFTTPKGISLAKSFLAYFAAYILCLIPHTREWLGRYSYWILLATLFNHPGRTFGAQIDGTASCIFGGALGLAVGSLALEVASSTHASEVGYGGVLTVFIVIFIGIASWIRCSLVRVYQTMISAGLAFLFLCLVGVDSITRRGSWDRRMLWEFGMPWIVGLGICLVINIIIWPEAGGKAVAYEQFLSIFTHLRDSSPNSTYLLRDTLLLSCQYT